MNLQDLIEFDPAEIKAALLKLTPMGRVKIWLAARHLADVVHEAQQEAGDLE